MTSRRFIDQCPPLIRTFLSSPSVPVSSVSSLSSITATTFRPDFSSSSLPSSEHTFITTFHTLFTLLHTYIVAEQHILDDTGDFSRDTLRKLEDILRTLQKYAESLPTPSPATPSTPSPLSGVPETVPDADTGITSFLLFHEHLYNYRTFVRSVDQALTTGLSSPPTATLVSSSSPMSHGLPLFYRFVIRLPFLHLLELYPNILAALITDSSIRTVLQGSLTLLTSMFDGLGNFRTDSSSPTDRVFIAYFDSLYHRSLQLAYSVWDYAAHVNPEDASSPTAYLHKPSVFYTDFDCSLTTQDTTEMYTKFSLQNQSSIPRTIPSTSNQNTWNTLVHNYTHNYQSMYDGIVSQVMEPGFDMISVLSSSSIPPIFSFNPSTFITVMDTYGKFEEKMVMKVESERYPNSANVLSGITSKQINLNFPADELVSIVPEFLTDATRTLFSIHHRLNYVASDPNPSSTRNTLVSDRNCGIISANWSDTFLRSCLRYHAQRYQSSLPPISHTSDSSLPLFSSFTDLPIFSNSLVMTTSRTENGTTTTEEESTGALIRNVTTPYDKFVIYRSILRNIVVNDSHRTGLSWYVGDSPADLMILLSVDIGVIIPKHARTHASYTSDAAVLSSSSSVSPIRELATALGITVLPLSVLSVTTGPWSKLVTRIRSKARESIGKRYAFVRMDRSSTTSDYDYQSFIKERAAYDEDLQCPVLFEAVHGWTDILNILSVSSVGSINRTIRNHVRNELVTDAQTLYPPIVADHVTSCVRGTLHVVTDLATSSSSSAPSSSSSVPKVLIIAGSDSGGGAGIQADMKTCSALGVFSTTAITAITAQDTCGVHGIHSIPIDLIHHQIDVVVHDIEPQIIKTGMLHNQEVITTVVNAIRTLRRRTARSGNTTASANEDIALPLLVLDPVMVSASGHYLIEPPAVTTLVKELFSLAHIVTPNIPETEFILDTVCGKPTRIRTTEDMVNAAVTIGSFGPTFVLIKGGHLDNEQSTVVTDVLYETSTRTYTLFESKRTLTRNTHGTGCTLASAIASCLARAIVRRTDNENEIPRFSSAFVSSLTIRAVSSGREFLQTLIHGSVGLSIGYGKHGPMNHHCLIDDYDLGDNVWRRMKTDSDKKLSSPSHTHRVSTSSSSSTVPSFDLRLYAVTDSACNAKHNRTLVQAVWQAIKGGATIIQLREKHLETKDFIAAAKSVMDTIRSARKGSLEFSTAFPDIGMTPSELSKIKILINDRIDVALAVDADGVHIGQDDMPLTIARRLLGPEKIIGVTASTPEEAIEALNHGADYLGTNAIFATATKTDHPPMGVDSLSLICKIINKRIPIVAIGGINLHNVKEVLATNVDGVAVVSAIYDKADTVKATQELRELIDTVRTQPSTNGSTVALSSLSSSSSVSLPSFRVLIKPLPSFISPKQRQLTSLPVKVPSFALACLEASQDVWRLCHTHPFVTALANGTLPSSLFRFYQMQDARYLQAFGDACCIVASRIPKVDDKEWFIDAAKLSLVVEKDLHLSYGQELQYNATMLDELELTPNNTGYTNHLLNCANNGTFVEAIASLTPCPHLYGDIGRNTLHHFLLPDSEDGSSGNKDTIGSRSNSGPIMNGAAALPITIPTGSIHHRMAEIPGNHPYIRWLKQYADESFVTYTERMLNILQDHALLSGWKEGHTCEDLLSLSKQHPLRKAQIAFLNSCRYEYMFWDQAWNTQKWPEQ